MAVNVVERDQNVLNRLVREFRAVDDMQDLFPERVVHCGRRAGGVDHEADGSDGLRRADPEERSELLVAHVVAHALQEGDGRIDGQERRTFVRIRVRLVGELIFSPVPITTLLDRKVLVDSAVLLRRFARVERAAVTTLRHVVDFRYFLIRANRGRIRTYCVRSSRSSGSSFRRTTGLKASGTRCKGRWLDRTGRTLTCSPVPLRI